MGGRAGLIHLVDGNRRRLRGRREQRVEVGGGGGELTLLLLLLAERHENPRYMPGLPLPARVTGTNDPELFAWQRYGHFSYEFPVPAGKYRVRLLFAETFFGPNNRGKGGVGSRVFNVYTGGTAILRQFDVFKEGGENRAVEKVFHGISPNPQGRIELRFEPVVQYPMVQAIEILPEGSGA